MSKREACYQILQELKDRGECIAFTSSGVRLELEPVPMSDTAIKALAHWREQFWDAFPAKFKVTLKGTRSWLEKQVIQNPDRFLFMIQSPEGYLGHLGLFRFSEDGSSCEIDNVVKGCKGFPGLMTDALREVMTFSFRKLKLKSLSLRVYSDNKRAIRLYERCAFEEAELIPLVKHILGKDSWEWVEVDDNKKAERFFCRMVARDRS